MFRGLRRHAIVENAHDVAQQFFVLYRGGQKLFAGSLVKSDSMKFVAADVPPSRHDRIGQEAGHDFPPDEGLHVFRGDEILFGIGKYVWQVRQRSDQMRASASRGAGPKQQRSLPDVFYSKDGGCGKVMRTNEKRVVVKDLSARRLVVRIVETYQGVAKKRSELATSLRKLRGRGRRFDDLGQIGAQLQFCVTVIVNPCRPLISFTGMENRLRHLKFPELSSQGKQSIGYGLHVGDVMQSVT